MSITQAEKDRAIEISQALQSYFDKTKCVNLRSTDVYPILRRRGLVEEDRHNGLRFRQFLMRLHENKMLTLIPQCTIIPGKPMNEWYFNSAKNRTVPQYLTSTIPSNERPKIDNVIKEEFILRISGFAIANLGVLRPQELDTRQKYHRAYDPWSKEEESIMLEAFEQTKDLYLIEEILQRQPSAIMSRLERLGVSI